MTTRFITALLFSFTALSSIPALSNPTADAISPAQFDDWMEQISNWGRWGDDDELGTLNLIGPQQRKATACWSIWPG